MKIDTYWIIFSIFRIESQIKSNIIWSINIHNTNYNLIYWFSILPHFLLLIIFFELLILFIINTFYYWITNNNVILLFIINNILIERRYIVSILTIFKKNNKTNAVSHVRSKANIIYELNRYMHPPTKSQLPRRHGPNNPAWISA
jgi:hypothetical protein